MDGDTRSGGAEGTGRGAERRGGPSGDALAAARAALAALDKANAAGDSETSSRDELAAAWRALTELGEAQGAGAVDTPPGARRTSSDESEWALPVVDAPPPRFDAPAEPAARRRSAPGDGWAVPVLDAPVTGSSEGADTRAERVTPPPAARPTGSPGTSPSTRRPATNDTEWALPVVDAPPSRFETPPEPTTPHRSAPDNATWAPPVVDAPSPPPASPPPAPAPSHPHAPSPRRLSGDPDAEWAAPVLDAPPSPDPEEAGDVQDRPVGDGPFAGRRREGADATRHFASDSVAPEHAAEPGEAELDAVRQVLAAGGAPVRLAGPALTALGPDAADLLREDPWNLLALPGISPQQADLFARGAPAAGTPDPDDPRRTLALVTWHLRRAADRGHTAVGAPSVVGALSRLGVRDAWGSLRAAYDHGRIMAFAEPPDDSPSALEIGDKDDEFDGFDDTFDDGFGHPFDSPEDRVTVALERHALAEESIAEAVVRLLSTVAPPLDDAVSDVPAADDTALSRTLHASGVTLYVSGAGEDPPEAPLALARALGSRALVLCPTADGAARVRTFLAAAAEPGTRGGPVVTTPRALFADREISARGADGLVDTDLLVVCEAHLLDVQDAAALLETVPDGTRVILCGDPGELQPAAPGRVFADLRDSSVVPVVVSSGQGPGVLGRLASAVRAGTLPPVESPDRQVVLVGVRGAAEAVHRCVQLVGDSIPRALGIPSDDIVVVTPAEGGSTGATALNAALKQQANPGPGRYDGFDIGDRVVRVPGPRTVAPVEGRVVDAVPDGLAVVFRDAPDRTETVPRARLGELRHGWALTVRQALGLRRPGVVAVLPGDAGDLVTRALVYTAFTRARRHLSVVHPADGTLPQAVASKTGSVRTTRLAAALREAADHMLDASPTEP